MKGKGHIQKFNEHQENLNISDVSDSKIKELKSIISELPRMRWNIAERDEDNEDFPYGYFGDEWDNWEHMEENERAEYFGKIFSCVKRVKDIIDTL
jgi:hypothetical protein